MDRFVQWVVAQILVQPGEGGTGVSWIRKKTNGTDGGDGREESEEEVQGVDASEKYKCKQHGTIPEERRRIETSLIREEDGGDSFS